MFVLVRWEPIVHDDYPWIIPFWVELVGIPLHLWTDDNLRRIGGRLGHVDTIELSEGRMLIDIDSRRPLKFKRKVESPEGDEVTIEIKYEMLYKHCTLCGLMTHEKGYCPTAVPNVPPPPERPGVFERVQLPQGQPLLNDPRGQEQRSSARDEHHLGRHSSRFGSLEVNRNKGNRYHDDQRHDGGFQGRSYDMEL